MVNNIVKYNSKICLNLDELRDYAKGLFSKEEVVEVKKHLANCELCSDAVDGYSYLKENNLQTKISKINRQIKKRSLFIHPSKGKFLLHQNFHKWVSSASITLSILIVLGTMIYMHFAWLKYSKLKTEEYMDKNNIELLTPEKSMAGTTTKKEIKQKKEMLTRREKHKLTNTKTKKFSPLESIASELEPELALDEKEASIVPPVYLDGQALLIKKFKRKLKSEKIVLKENLTIRFIIKANGTIENIAIENEFPVDKNKKISQIMQQFNHWQPASKNDQRIDYEMQIIIPAL